MNFETLVDIGDYFDSEADAIGDAFTEADELSGGIPYGEEYTPPPVKEQPPIEVPKYEEPPQIKQIDEMVKKAEEPSPELLSRVEQAARKEGESGIKKFFDELSEKDRNSLLRYSLGAMGMGASQALRAIQQKREQEFQREQTDRAYAERRGEEERAREERMVRGTPQAMQFNVAPRGIIGGGMGG